MHLLPRVLFLFLVVGCTANDAEWDVVFEESSAQASAVAVDSHVLVGSCEAGLPLFSFSSNRDTPSAPSEVEIVPGTYTLRSEARTGSCERIASGCQVVDLPSGSREVVTLRAAEGYGCPGSVCNGGSCEKGPGRTECSRDGRHPAVSLGATTGCALSADCVPVCWPLSSLASSPMEVSRFQAVSLGGETTCTLDDTGSATCSGNTNRELEGRSFISFDTNGALHCGVTEEGSIMCAAESGGTQEFTTEALYSAVFLGPGHNCATDHAGQLYCWGDNDFGQLGTAGGNQSEPTRVPGAQCWAAAALGVGHTCAVTCEGQLFCWGDNSDGQLGAGDSADGSMAQVGELSDWRAVSAGEAHTCALRSDSTLWCWGDGTRGQLGTGTNASSSVPLQVGSGSFVAVGANGDDTCAIDQNDSVFCWGSSVATALPEAVN